MKYTHARHRVMSVVAALLIIGLALPGYAETKEGEDAAGGAKPGVLAPAVIITEVQTGAEAAGDEFVELYNQGDTPADIGDWHVRYLNAGASGVTTLMATIDDGVTLPAHTHYVLHTSSVPLTAGVLGQEYNATLSNKDKVIGLYAPDQATCTMRVRDALAWGVATGGEGRAVPVRDDDTPRYLYRHRTPAGLYVDTQNNAHDFGMVVGAAKAMPTAGSINSQLITTPQAAWPAAGPGASLPPVQVKDCSVPPANEPAPHAPPAPPVPPAQSPPAVVESVDEDDAPRPKIPERNIGLLAPQISELLPNPAKPQTDANDEFIELYNANNARFELSGFVMEVGTKTKKRFTFPEGVMLAPKSFTAFTSADTNLALSNTQGQVWLLDPLGRVIGQSEPYQSAKDGQAWLTADGAWQWTTMPTPNAINIVKKPAAKKAAAATTTSRAATTGVKGVASSNTSSPAVADQKESESQKGDSSFNPLHPGILALTGVLAVLYAVYEYRRDLANKFHQFRANRAARRSLRQNAERR